MEEGGDARGMIYTDLSLKIQWKGRMADHWRLLRRIGKIL